MIWGQREVSKAAGKQPCVFYGNFTALDASITRALKSLPSVSFASGATLYRQKSTNLEVPSLNLSNNNSLGPKSWVPISPNCLRFFHPGSFHSTTAAALGGVETSHPSL